MVFKVFLGRRKASLKILKKITLVDFDEKSHYLDDIWGATTKLGMPGSFKNMEKMLWDMDNAMQKTKC